MNQSLNQQQIDYILFHLSFFVDLKDLTQYFLFSENPHPIQNEVIIFFPLNNDELEYNKIKYFDDIPILFPLDSSNTPYQLINGNLIFNHDFIKSAFYLLSGYQEFNSNKRDEFGRYPFEGSIQERLNIIEKPVVNYYFKWIIEGLKIFSASQNIRFCQKKPFNDGTFFLSHDIDRIAKYDYYETLHKLLEFVGIKPSNFSRIKLTKLISKYLFNFLFFPLRYDPYWNFDKLRKIERSLNIHSTWFFLEKKGKHTNSRYLFSNKKIKNVMQFLVNENCEIGLHGTVDSASNINSLNETLSNLKKYVACDVVGIRQHKLILNFPKTLKFQELVGLSYDNTLTFAGHEGFRNSYCFPFRPFDFENNKMMDIWEIPLVVMDGTLFYYRKLSYEKIETQISNLVEEIRKFGGVFSLLWHNSHFDEDEFPGIEKFYIDLLELIIKSGLEPLTGREIIERINI